MQRLKALQKKLALESFDLCLIEQPLDLLYYTGLALSAGRLIVARSSAALFVDGRYIQMAKEKAPMKAALDTPDSVAGFIKAASGKKCAFDSGNTSYDRFLRLKKALDIQLVPAAHFFATLRAVKDASEIEKMRKSAELLYKGFLHIRSLLKTGITEREVARRFEIFSLENGAEKLSFEPIIAFGANSAMPHYRSQDIALKSGDIVLIDIGVVLSKYHSDMTRVLFFQKASPFFQKIYSVVKEAHDAALSLCRPGITVAKLDEAARSVMRKEEMESYFLHSLGHGIGLQTHEFPRLKSQGEDTKTLLEPGMVVTVEPGLYYAGRGGIRYEDTVVVTEKGYENLYPDMDSAKLIVPSKRKK